MQLLPIKEIIAGHLGILLLLLEWKKCQISTIEQGRPRHVVQQPQQIRPEVVLPWGPNLTAEGRAQNRRATDNGILLFCLGWSLAEQKVVSLPWTASVEIFCHKFVYILLKTASEHVTSFNSTTHKPVEYRHTFFALHCCLLLRALREKMVEKCILLSSCHSVLQTSVAHPCFPSTSSLLIWRNPVLFDVPCMKTLPYSCCPFQSFWRAFLC